jgi:hypothetical protein
LLTPRAAAMSASLGLGGSLAADKANTSTEQPSNAALTQMLNEHALAPASISSLEVHGATNTRKSLLDHVFKPVIDDTAPPGTTMGQVLDRVTAATKKLARFGARYTSLFVASLEGIFTNIAERYLQGGRIWRVSV